MKRLHHLLKSKLNACNFINAINTWAVFVVKYSGAVVVWTKQELKTLGILFKNGVLFKKLNMIRLYIPQKEGGRKLIGIE